MDIPFEVAFVPQSAIDRACRGAVLSSILGKKGKRPDLSSDEMIIKAMNKVLKLWRMRTVLLRDAGWEDAAGVSFQYLRNCPPWGVAVNQCLGDNPPRQCWRSYICPWCWQRQMILPVYHRLKDSMSQLGMTWEKGRVDYPLKLIGKRFSFHKGPGLTAADAFELVSGFARRGREKSKKKYEGVITSISVSPAKENKFRLSSGVVFLAPLDWEGESRMVVTSPSKRNLARLAAYLCPYPRSMLTAPVGPVLEILSARKFFRLISSTGAFHGSWKEEVISS
jgi:hypothetical protein